MAKQTQREWLAGQQMNLLEALRECEELAFHHSPAGTVEAQHYARVIVLKEGIDAQVKANGIPLKLTQE